MFDGFVQVILAAGEGRRAGGYKPLFPLGQGVVIDRVISAGQAVCREIRVVGGSHYPDLERYLKQSYPHVQLIRNDRWKTGGMFSSVLLGLTGCVGPAFIHPADIPGPGPEIYQALSIKMRESNGDVVRPVYQGRGGHPILLSAEAVTAVRSSLPSSNLRAVLGERVKVDVEVSESSVLFDLDTNEDYLRLQEKFKFEVKG